MSSASVKITCHLWLQFKLQYKRCPLTLSEKTYNFFSTQLLLSITLAYLKTEVLVILLVLCSPEHIVLEIHLLKIFQNYPFAYPSRSYCYARDFSVSSRFPSNSLSSFEDFASTAQLFDAFVGINHSFSVFAHDVGHSQPANA